MIGSPEHTIQKPTLKFITEENRLRSRMQAMRYTKHTPDQQMGCGFESVTRLRAAVFLGSKKTLLILIEHDADIEAKDSYGQPALR